MNVVTASAPGKIVLSGEYAVLDGAPAVCMAVDRRARVTIETHVEEWHRVIAPGFSAVEGRFVARKDHFEWLGGGDSYSLLEHVWREINPVPDSNLSYSLDTREFLDAHSGNKIGLGSSAALAAALATSLCAIFAPHIDARQAARAAHRKFQNGVGSGVDVACSLQGGVIEYSMDRKQRSQLDWPDGLAFAVLWSGVPSGTAEKLARVGRIGARQSRADLVKAAEQMAMAWRERSAQHILDGYRTYTNVLRKFSVDHDLGIFDAGHGELVDAANEMGLIYKPCGAGGGDVGITFARDEATIATFVASPVTAGFEQLNVAIDPHGTQLFREKH